MPAQRVATADAWFEDATADSGLGFQHVNGMSGQLYLAEIMGPGVALLDYDNDGDLDVYTLQGGPLKPGAPPGAAGGDRLFRNELDASAASPRLRFSDVTATSGLTGGGYGMGVATGDVDNDGWTDLLVLRLGSLALLRNTGDGRFADITEASGLRAPSWGGSASFVDYDRDGWLDLYLANYLLYTVAADTDCFAASGAPAYCSPRSYRPEPDRLYRNRGDGRFEDVTAAARVTGENGPGLGVVAFDANGDDWSDLYVANDGTANTLWINQKDGTFIDTGLVSGSAVSGDGRPEGSMGVDAGDFDNDGDEDLVMTHIAGEGHNVYRNLGAGTFIDASTEVGVGTATLPFTGFGATWADVDNDGWLDLLTVNGAIQRMEALTRTGDPFPLSQPNQAFRNQGGRLIDATSDAGAAFRAPQVSRGLAVGDIDNDGDLDAVIAANNGALRLLRNTVGHRRHWIGVRLVARRAGSAGRARETAGRDMLGAKVVVRAGALTLTRGARTDGSYASARDPRVLVGLGDAAGPVSVRVTWPDGRSSEQTLAADRWHAVVESPP
jgi:enediyne biosynthesis protein E4